MPGPSGESCRDCYFTNAHEGQTVGYCHLKPPKWSRDTEDWRQAEVSLKNDWCGEFKPKPDVPK